MIIDFHTHVFPQKIAAPTIAELEKKSGINAATDGTSEGLLASMSAAGVDCSVVMPVVTAPRQFDSITRFARSLNEEFAQLISFGGIHPGSENYKEELQLLNCMGFKGIKLHPDYQGVNFDDIRYKRIVSYASELGMVVLVHAGIDIGLPNPVRCTPAMAVEVLKETQASRLVLAHLGGWKLWDEVEELLMGSNAFLDTSFIHPYIEKEQFLRIVREHGKDKLLFGTDSPWAKQDEAVKWIKDCNLPAETEEAIFYKNALTLLR